MSKVSKFLRRGKDGYFHWCVACGEMHPLPDGWQFNGDINKPTFTPSFKHEGVETIKDENGKWTGEFKKDKQGNPKRFICHYILTNGILNYCSDCTHSMAGQSVPIAELPKYYQDVNDD